MHMPLNVRNWLFNASYIRLYLNGKLKQKFDTKFTEEAGGSF